MLCKARGPQCIGIELEPATMPPKCPSFSGQGWLPCGSTTPAELYCDLIGLNPVPHRVRRQRRISRDCGLRWYVEPADVVSELS